MLAKGATGPADSLAGSFDVSAIQPGDSFTLSGFGNFAGPAAGSALNGLGISFSNWTLGRFSRAVVRAGFIANASGQDLAIAVTSLQQQGTVVAVPESGSWLLMATGALLLAQRFTRVSTWAA